MMAVGRRLGNILNSCCFIAVHPKEDEKVEEDNSSSEIQELGEPVKGYVEEEKSALAAFKDRLLDTDDKESRKKGLECSI